jgi:hypothetical protein
VSRLMSHRARAHLRRTPLAGRSRVSAICIGATALAIVATQGAFVPVAQADGSCPNAALRVGPSAQLPDCRAYEMVSPADKNLGPVAGVVRSSTAGPAVAWYSIAAYADPHGIAVASAYVGRRSGAGWSTTQFSPFYRAPNALPTTLSGQSEAFTDDLSRMFDVTQASLDDGDQDLGGFLGEFGQPDVYAIDAAGNATWLSQPLTLPDTEQTPVSLAGYSGNGSTVFLSTPERLSTGVPPSSTDTQLYRWRAGHIDVVGVDANGQVLPGGAWLGDGRSAVLGGTGQQGNVADSNAVSSDGSRFVYRGGPQNYFDGSSAQQAQLYVHEDGRPAVQLSVSHLAGTIGQPAPHGAKFLTSAADVSIVFFYCQDQLTSDAPADGGVYRYDVATAQLTFSNPDEGEPTFDTNGNWIPAADPAGLVKVSSDGSHVYFVSTSALAGGATAHDANLYVRSAVGTRFIAAVSPSDGGQAPDPALSMIVPLWASQEALNGSGRELTTDYTSATTTPDGSKLVFTSTMSRPGYQNNGQSEVYLYDASSGDLTCVSCRQDGVPAQGSSSIIWPSAYFGTGGIAAPRSISDDGNAVAFTSNDALLPTDTNGRPDVYELENGHLSLLSSGTSSQPSVLAGVSPDGQDVFFTTSDSLVTADTDQGLADVYDARVGGGIAAQNPPAPTPACVGDACQGLPSAPPALPTAGSAVFSGAGNAVETTPPKGPTLTVSPISKAAQQGFARTGRLTLSVRVSAAGKVSATASATIDKHTRTVASAGKTASHGGTVRPVLRLSKQARRQLATKRTLVVRIVVGYSRVTGTRTALLTLHSKPSNRAARSGAIKVTGKAGASARTTSNNGGRS